MAVISNGRETQRVTLIAVRQGTIYFETRDGKRFELTVNPIEARMIATRLYARAHHLLTELLRNSPKG